MGAAGLTHRINVNAKSYLRTTLAGTANGLDLVSDTLNKSGRQLPESRIDNQNGSIVLSAFLSTRFNARHTNKTGLTATRLSYNVLLKEDPQNTGFLQTVADQKGYSNLIAAYTNSTFNISDRVSLNLGINTQWFTLNNRYTIEPRAGLKYEFKPNQFLSIGYGLHSRLERINYYFARNTLNQMINKDLDFTKAHHYVIGYDRNLSENLHLKVEAYYQNLFNVPVIADSSFSFINVGNDWFFNSKVGNKGNGRNYGLDISLDKYLNKGYYYLLTASVFNSEYKAGDQIWRNTRYNRKFTVNFLIGKEWQLGKSKQNVLGVNSRYSYQGGDRYSAPDAHASDLKEEPVFNERDAFSKQFRPSFTSHFTIMYTINKAKSTREIALKVLNANMYKEFSGFRYNYKTRQVEQQREAIFIPNLSYRIDF